MIDKLTTTLPLCA